MEENLEYVQKGFRILHPAMAAYIAEEMSREYQDEWWNNVLESLGEQGRDLPTSGERADLIDSLDLLACFQIIDRQWGPVFRKRMERDRRSWVIELMGVRNKTAHSGSKDIDGKKAERALDTMALLCDEFDPQKAEEIRTLLRTLRYGCGDGSIAASEANAAPRPVENNVGAAAHSGGSALPSWREVMEPHPDVAQGRYRATDFAANLNDVAHGIGPFEYRDPVEFFARTYITEGVKGLLVEAARRLSGDVGEPVLQLKTAFGGGKTHSLLALYHMARGGVSLKKLPNLQTVLYEAGLKEAPNAKVAVIVGTALDPSRSKRPANLPGVTVNTAWGEIAAQLAIAADNPKLYDFVKEADKKGTAPGSEALRNLFDACGPCLVLMDELVAYAKKIYGISGLPAGSFDNFITFIQEITEAASASKNSMVVASIPESEIEVGKGEGGKLALEAIEHTFGRKESIWKPVSASEGFEVVRRRLFIDCQNPAERDRVCTAFSQTYQRNERDFPIDAREVGYRDRMISCYPIHPEIFDRLYEEWATLERFQRTRGVLRLMAAVIHELWMARDESAMIMPGSFPLAAPPVREELIRHLDGAWNAIVDTEVDGKNAVPYKLEKSNVRYGKTAAARRVARTIMLGSAPTVRAQSIRGIEASRIRLGVVQPGENIADFNDALNTLRGSLSYLYADPVGNRFWYDTRPTLRKTASDRASQIASADVEYEIEKRLKELKKTAPLAALHVCPASSADVADEQSARLVVLKPSDTHKAKDEDSPAMARAKEILESRGLSSRIYKNMLVFVAPDGAIMPDLKKAVAELLAWESIKKDSVRLNLDAAQNSETNANIARCKETVDVRLKEVYCWLIVPGVDSNGDRNELLWEAEKLVGADPTVSKVAKRLAQNEQIISKWAPLLLKMELDNLLWKDADHIQIKQLWDYLATYCYLPRLANFSVLEETVRDGVLGGFFAIASDARDGGYENLRAKANVLKVYPTDYLVKPSVAGEQIRKEEEAARPTGQGETKPAPEPRSPSDAPGAVRSVGSTRQPEPTPVAPAPEAKDRRFFMSVKLDNIRAIKDLEQYLNEVITHLSDTDGCEVELTLEVDARAEDGFARDTVRVVSENCRTLGVEDFGFKKQ